MIFKTRLISVITILFVSCTLLLYYLDRLQSSSSSSLQLPYALWSSLIMAGLFMAIFVVIHQGCNRYSLLLAKNSAQLEETTRSLLETQAGLEEIVERRTFELAVVNGSLHREIAERIQAETESKKLQKRFEIILNSAGEGILGLDSTGKITFINKTAARILGWRRQDLIGQSHHDLVHHSHQDGSRYPLAQCPIYAAYKDGTIHCSSDETFWTRSGTSFPVEYTSTPMVEDDALTGAVVIFKDISENNKLKKQLELIVNSAGEGIFGLDTEGRVTFCNKAASIMLGWEPEELIGKSHHDLVHHTHEDGTHYPVDECPIYMAYKDGAVHYKSNDMFWTRSGESFSVEYTSTPIRENNQLTGAVVVFRDMNIFD